jgi:hypothetical protein
MTVNQFQEAHNDPKSAYHPMNVLDVPLADSVLMPLEMPVVLTNQLSFGHILMTSPLYQTVPESPAVELVKGVSKYALMSEAGCQTNFHQDFSGTSVMYVLLFGRKSFFVVSPSQNNCERLKKWDESATKE